MEQERKAQLLEHLVASLCDERGIDAPATRSADELWSAFRALVNTRPPMPADERWLRMQDELLKGLIEDAGTALVADAVASPADPRIRLWRGDITTLAADAVVDAANSQMLGCWRPGHHCIDNAIHSAAGLQLREACATIMAQRRAAGLGPEPTGEAEITPGFHLPARHVLHTVGPIVSGRLTNAHRAALASSYRSCLGLAASHGLRTVALCCVSTGVFGFPQDQAARIAVSTTAAFLDSAAPGASRVRVVFDVFGARDEELYRRELGL